MINGLKLFPAGENGLSLRKSNYFPLMFQVIPVPVRVVLSLHGRRFNVNYIDLWIRVRT